MYVTEILNGRPYQCFIPQPLFPAVEASRIKAFATLDREFKRNTDAAVFIRRAAAIIAQTRDKPDDANRLAEAEAVLNAWIGRERLGTEQLKKISAAFTGKHAAVFRSRPVWMGAMHPSHSWHVGSRPARLNGLMKTLVDLPQSNLPASLQALIGLIRLLQIHPFEDGNGRVARFYAIWLVYRQLGPSIGVLNLLDALCDRPRFDLNAVSLEVQNSGRLEGYLDRALCFYSTDN